MRIYLSQLICKGVATKRLPSTILEGSKYIVHMITFNLYYSPARKALFSSIFQMRKVRPISECRSSDSKILHPLHAVTTHDPRAFTLSLSGEKHDQ